MLGIGLSAATLSVGEASSSLTITVEILSGSLELYVSANITAFSRANDTAVASEYFVCMMKEHLWSICPYDNKRIHLCHK